MTTVGRSRTSAKALTGPADIRDAKRLAELEVVIERGKAAFIEVGEALIEVRESRLYRLTYGTFEDYCRLRWGFTDRHARRLMEAAEVAAYIETGPIGPVTESQARELAPLLRSDGEDAVREAWSEAVARSDGKPTAKVVRQVVAEIIEPPSMQTATDEDETDLDAGPNEEARAEAYRQALRAYLHGIARVQPPTLGDPPELYRRRHALERRLLDVLAEVMA